MRHESGQNILFTLLCNNMVAAGHLTWSFKLDLNQPIWSVLFLIFLAGFSLVSLTYSYCFNEVWSTHNIKMCFTREFFLNLVMHWESVSSNFELVRQMVHSGPVSRRANAAPVGQTVCVCLSVWNMCASVCFWCISH